MHILITGGTGLIGQRIIERLPHYRYTVVTRSPQQAYACLPDDVGVMNLDDLESLDDVDVVINLAGEPIADKRWTETQKQAICNSRWDTTHKLVKAILASDSPPKVFISGSAVGYYGDGGDKELDENSGSQSADFAHFLCSKWEVVAKQASSRCRVCLLRTGIVLGNGGALNKMWWPFKLGLGGPVGQGDQYWPWIHIDDMVGGIDFLIHREDLSGSVNMVAPQSVTNLQFSQTLAKVLHRKAWFPMPRWFIQLIMGESAQLLLNSQRVVPAKLLDAQFRFRYSDLDSALQAVRQEKFDT